MLKACNQYLVPENLSQTNSTLAVHRHHSLSEPSVKGSLKVKIESTESKSLYRIFREPWEIGIL